MTIRSSALVTALLLASCLGIAWQACTQPVASVEQSTQEELTELDYPVDSAVQVLVDPVLPSTLVDRVGAPATIAIRGAGLLTADVYSVPVDAPYGGLVLAKPHYIGHAMRGANALLLKWDTVEPCKYLKIFAVIRKRGMPAYARTRTLDLCMIGPRLKADTP